MSDNDYLPSRVQNLLGILIVIVVIILIVLLPFMGFSSFATEPTPLLGDNFSLWVIFILFITSCAFFIASEKIQNGESNGS